MMKEYCIHIILIQIVVDTVVAMVYIMDVLISTLPK